MKLTYQKYRENLREGYKEKGLPSLKGVYCEDVPVMSEAELRKEEKKWVGYVPNPYKTKAYKKPIVYNHPRAKKVVRLDLKSGETKEYLSLRQAAEFNHIDNTILSRYCTGKMKQEGNYSFQYV